MFMVFNFKEVFHGFDFPVFNGLGVLWSFGFLMIFSILLQVVSGILFSCGLLGLSVNGCYDSKFNIFLDIYYGWFLVSVHMFFPSFIFFLMFFHMFSVFIYYIYYYSYSWLFGYFLFIVFIFISFTGYSMVGSSMGYLAISVVYNMFCFIFGYYFGEFVFFNVNVFCESVFFKLFTYHFVLGVFSFLFMYFHIYFNHSMGSSSVCSFYLDFSSFFSLLIFSDLYLLILFILFVMFVFLNLDLFFNYDSFILFDLFVMPEEVNVEWYLSIFFVVLSVFYLKWLGLLFVFLFLLFLFYKFFNKGLLGFQFLFVFFNFLVLYFYYYIILNSCFLYNSDFLFSYSFSLFFLLLFMFIEFWEVFVIFIFLL